MIGVCIDRGTGRKMSSCISSAGAHPTRYARWPTSFPRRPHPVPHVSGALSCDDSIQGDCKKVVWFSTCHLACLKTCGIDMNSPRFRQDSAATWKDTVNLTSGFIEGCRCIKTGKRMTRGGNDIINNQGDCHEYDLATSGRRNR